MIYTLSVIGISLLLMTAVITAAAFLRNSFLEKMVWELDRQKSNYESIIEQAMFVIDIADGRVHQCNPSAGELLGYTPRELVSKTLFDLQPPEFLLKSSQTVADVWEKRGLIFDDIPFVRADGSQIPVECSAKVAPFSGRPAIVIYARDITERLTMQNEIRHQSAIIEEKNKDITASIEYSKRIQRSVFLEKDLIKKYCPESFIFFRPRDIVSGDFYWFWFPGLEADGIEAESAESNGDRRLWMAAVDCTGHGVPGAFMSIIGNTLLNRTITDPTIKTPAEVLNFMNREIKKMLNQKQDSTPVRDGMDMALVKINFSINQLSFAGANNPAYVIRNGEITELKPHKQPITASPDSGGVPFTDQELKLEKGDVVYLFSDGFPDQFGGEKGKKFLYKRFKELLVSIAEKPMEEQKQILQDTLSVWKGDLPQVDDILVMGVRV
jgi:PAS domain S-box-containing protein